MTAPMILWYHKSCSFFIAILFIMSIGSAVAGVHQEVKFPRGSSSATIEQTVIRGERDRYVLGVGKGQYLAVKIESIEDNAVFDVYLPGANDKDETDIKGTSLLGATESKFYVGELPASGKFLIVVGGTRGNAEYKLKISVTNDRPQTPIDITQPPVQPGIKPTAPTASKSAGNGLSKQPDNTVKNVMIESNSGLQTKPSRAPTASSAISSIPPSISPDDFFKRHISSGVKFFGTENGKASPSKQITFSNGHMEAGSPGHEPIFSGPIMRGTTPNGTCVSFQYKYAGDNQMDLCVAVRDFDYLGLELKKGDLYIIDSMGPGVYGPATKTIYKALMN